jgi:hypothetical protein
VAGEEEEEGGGDGTVRGGGALCAPYNAPHKEEPGHTMATVAAEQARCVAPAARPPGARSARAPPRRVQLVREEGRDVSGLYGREGGGDLGAAPPPRPSRGASTVCGLGQAARMRRRARRAGPCGPAARRPILNGPRPLRTNRTRRVPHPVLSGRVLNGPRPLAARRSSADPAPADPATHLTPPRSAGAAAGHVSSLLPY